VIQPHCEFRVGCRLFGSKSLLGRGERKSLQTDRVILDPGPEQEIEVVQQIYTRFVTAKQTRTRNSRAAEWRGDFGGK